MHIAFSDAGEPFDAGTIKPGAALQRLVEFCRRNGHILDHPNERKLHNSPIPRIGGLAIFVSVIGLRSVMKVELQNSSTQQAVLTTGVTATASP